MGHKGARFRNEVTTSWIFRWPLREMKSVQRQREGVAREDWPSKLAPGTQQIGFATNFGSGSRK